MSLTHETSYDTVDIARGAYDAVTYCRLCEAMCGLVATVDNGRVTSLAPDPDHPLSRGRACPKGLAFVEITNDPDRVLHPLRRNAVQSDSGRFRPGRDHQRFGTGLTLVQCLPEGFGDERHHRVQQLQQRIQCNGEHQPRVGQP